MTEDILKARQWAVAERESALNNLRQRRDELLRQAYSLTVGKDKPEEFGSGHVIGPKEPDDEALAFVKRFELDGDPIENAFPTNLSHLPPTPPDSPASATSEVIAANLVPQLSPKGARPATSEDKEGDATEAAPLENNNAPPAAESQTTATAIGETPEKPRSSLPTLLVQAPTAPPQLPATIDPAVLLQPPRDRATLEADRVKTAHIEMLDSYARRLPELPTDILRQRQLVGGLFRKKLKDSGRPSGSTAGLAGGSDLFKLGISKAQNMSVRNWMGVGPMERPHPPARTGKVLLTRDWNVAYRELRSLRAMERIEQVKAEGNWSLRQIKKQKGPVIPKAHRDYMLDEMVHLCLESLRSTYSRPLQRWMRTDFREERKWKLATAMMLVSCVKEWHEADEEGRRALCVRIRPPNALTESMNIDKHRSLHPEPAEEAEVEMEVLKPVDGQDTEVPVDPLPFAPTSEDRPPPSPISQQELYPLRAPLFEMPITTTVVSLDELPVAEMLAGTSESLSTQLLSLLTPDLVLYDGLQAPSETRVDRRYDESTPHHSRITPATHISQTKPLLLSTLEPAKKRRRLDGWNDLSDLLCMDRNELETKAENLPIGSTLFAGKRPKEISHAVPVVPPHYPKDTDLEARAASLDWTEQDDEMILKMTKEYAFNWRLIVEIFNSSTFRVSTDKRLEWDIYDRWNRKFGPGSNQASAVAGPSTDPMGGIAAANKNRDKYRKVIGKYEGGRRKLHQNALHDAIRRLQKSREKNYKPPPPAHLPRKINLNAHETHHVTTRPTMSPLEFSMWKAEIDRDRALRHAAALAHQQQVQRQAQQAALAARYPQGQPQVAQQAQRAGLPVANGMSPAPQAARPPSAAGSTGSPHPGLAQLAAPGGQASPRAATSGELPLEQQQQLLLDRMQKLRASGQGDSDQARAIAERLRGVQAQLMAQAQIAQKQAQAAVNGQVGGPSEVLNSSPNA